MKRSRKGYNLKALTTISSIIVLFTATTYSDHLFLKASNDYLRVPSIFQGKRRAERMAITYKDIFREGQRLNSISKKKVVLLVDDKQWVILTASQLFKNRGFDVITAGSSEEALELFESNNIDVVVSDVNLPGMNGDKLVRKIREKNNLPIFLMTASGEEYIAELQKEVSDLGIPVFDKLNLIKLINGIVAIVLEGNNRVLPPDVGDLKKLMDEL